MIGLLWLGLLLGLGLLQTFLPVVWAPLGVVDWLLIPVVHQALRGSFRRAVLLGAAAGIIQDGLLGGLIGLHGFAKTAVAGMVTAFSGFLVVRGPVAEGGITFVASLTESVIVATWLVLLGRPVAAGVGSSIGRAIATGIAVGLLLHLGKRWKQRRLRVAGRRRGIER